jgi:electron transfer flavoprotein alpha/beta subunit
VLYYESILWKDEGSTIQLLFVAREDMYCSVCEVSNPAVVTTTVVGIRNNENPSLQNQVDTKVRCLVTKVAKELASCQLSAEVLMTHPCELILLS